MEQKILSLKDDKIHSEVELYEYPVELRGGRNYFVVKDLTPKPYPLVGNDHEYTYNLEPNTTYTIKTWNTKGSTFRVNSSSVSFAITGTEGYTITTDSSGVLRIGLWYGNGETDQFINGSARLKLEKRFTPTDWTPAPEDLGLTYPDFITEFKPSISDRYILTEELIEYPVELIGGRNLAIMSRMINGYITAGTGVTTSIGPDVHDPNYYQCIAGDKFISKVYDLGELPRGGAGFMAFYDIDKQFISNFVMVQNAVGATRTATAPIGAKFYRYASTGIAVKFKLERGNKATPWTPAPEDLGLTYPDHIQSFGTSFSNNILINEFIEQ